MTEARSAAIVVAFWWAATGLTIAMQRGELAVVGLGATAGLGLVGFAMIYTTRDRRTPASARSAFIGAALLWWFTATLFYSGWGVAGPAEPAGPPRSIALAMQAIGATWRPDVVALGTIAAVAVLVWRRANRVALWVLVAFWGVLQTAKLNVFAGVRNPGEELLPQKLAGLAVFFGPRVNSLLLPITVLALLALGTWLALRAWRGREGFERTSSAVVAVLVALAVVEHVMLGVDRSLPLWNMFIAVRGQ